MTTLQRPPTPLDRRHEAWLQQARDLQAQAAPYHWSCARARCVQRNQAAVADLPDGGLVYVTCPCCQHRYLLIARHNTLAAHDLGLVGARAKITG